MSPRKPAAANNSPKSKDSPSKKVESVSKNDSPSKKGSPSKKETDADTHTKAMELFAQGKRNLLINDIAAAVKSLQEACRMLAEQHGETSPECGDAYFYYGRALLEMARMESDVLGNALEGVPEGEDLENSQVEDPDKMTEEEKEKVSEQVDEALQETSKALDAKKNGTSEAMDDGESKNDKDKDDTVMDTDDKEGGTEDESQDEESQDDSQEDGEGDDNGDGAEDGDDTKEGDDKEGEKSEEEDDVSNHQLAWEMLELAKVIYQKQEKENKEMPLKTAQVFLKLGEVGLESETFPQAIEDFQSCLKIQEKHMEADDRCLAETHYQLGVAHSFNDDFDKSIESFSRSLKIIEDRVKNLTKTKDLKKTPSKKTPFKENNKNSPKEPIATKDPASEIEELNNLIPEIKEKIEDMEEMKKDAKDKINKVKKELGMASAISGKPDGSSNGEAKQLSSSMIKKRKQEDEVNGDSKKTKSDKDANGSTSPEKMDTDKSDLKTKAAEDMEKKTKEIKKQDA